MTLITKHFLYFVTDNFTLDTSSVITAQKYNDPKMSVKNKKECVQLNLLTKTKYGKFIANAKNCNKNVGNNFHLIGM